MTPQFKQVVEVYGPRFMKDLSLNELKVSGMFGNFAVETDQFRALQEYKPVVAGSKGGWGWAQWTGPRRRQFEAWAKAQGFKLDDPEAFYGFTLHELATTEKRALAKLKETKTLYQATDSFRANYERPGVLHTQPRRDRALEALHVLEAHLAKGVPQAPVKAPEAPKVAPAAPAAPEAPVAVSAPKGEGWLVALIKALF